MKVSKAQMAENRSRILKESGRLFREKGFEAVSVAEVMKAAGMTHGGFYGHFASKDELIAQTLAEVLDDPAPRRGDLATYLDSYLSARHRDNPAHGCPTASLAADIRHQGAAARRALTKGLSAQIDTLAGLMPGEGADARRQAAIGTWATMVGALVLSRAVDDAALSDELLDRTRNWVEDRIEQDRTAAGKD